MRYPEGPDRPGIEDIVLLCLRRSLAAPGPEGYLSWATETIPRRLGDEWGDLPPEESRRLAYLLARAIWNSTPRPERGFRTQALKDPEAGGDCPCGSGSAYSACCGRVADAPAIPEEMIWELLLDELDADRILRALDSGRLPAQLVASAADRLLAAERPGRTVALLETLFERDAEALPDARLEQALNVLCDAYDRLNHWRKKIGFLERMTDHPCRALRAAAWQRLCTIGIDDGDFAAAQLAFRAGPARGARQPRHGPAGGHPAGRPERGRAGPRPGAVLASQAAAQRPGGGGHARLPGRCRPRPSGRPDEQSVRGHRPASDGAARLGPRRRGAPPADLRPAALAPSPGRAGPPAAPPRRRGCRASPGT